jgi:hypothetical protein
MDTNKNPPHPSPLPNGPRESPVPPPRQNSTVWLAVHVLFTDLLGAFIPGVFFTAVLVVSCGLFMVMLGDKIIWNSLVTNAESLKIFDSLSSCILFVFCIFSYIIGSVFYRKDIKEPDRASAAYVYNQIADEKEREFFAFGPRDSPADKPKKRLWVRVFQKIRNWRRRGPAKVSPNDLEVDFPYLYLKRYLEKRDLRHLAACIPWDGINQKTHQRRSKMFWKAWNRQSIVCLLPPQGTRSMCGSILILPALRRK